MTEKTTITDTTVLTAWDRIEDEVIDLYESGVWNEGYNAPERTARIIAIVKEAMLSEAAVDEASASISERLPDYWGDTAIAASIDMATEGIGAALTAAFGEEAE